jgi:hypothetical protein
VIYFATRPVAQDGVGTLGEQRVGKDAVGSGCKVTGFFNTAFASRGKKTHLDIIRQNNT